MAINMHCQSIQNKQVRGSHLPWPDIRFGTEFAYAIVRIECACSSESPGLGPTGCIERVFWEAARKPRKVLLKPIVGIRNTQTVISSVGSFS
jgi:hypothetical protein